jgi:hypothetical protein
MSDQDMQPDSDRVNGFVPKDKERGAFAKLAHLPRWVVWRN